MARNKVIDSAKTALTRQSAAHNALWKRRTGKKLPWQLELLAGDNYSFSLTVALVQQMLGLPSDGVMTDELLDRIVWTTERPPSYRPARQRGQKTRSIRSQQVLPDLSSMTELQRSVVTAACKAVQVSPVRAGDEFSLDWSYRCVEYGAGVKGVKRIAQANGMTTADWFRRCHAVRMAVALEDARWSVESLRPSPGDVVVFAESVAPGDNFVDKLESTCYTGVVIGVADEKFRTLLPVRSGKVWEYAVVESSLDTETVVGFVRTVSVVCG